MGAMKCPVCGCFATQVLDSRPAASGEQRKRRYECRECKGRFNTIEMWQEAYEGLAAEKSKAQTPGVEKGAKSSPEGEKGKRAQEQPGEEKTGETQKGETQQGETPPRGEKVGETRESTELKPLGVREGGGCDG